MLYFNKVGDLMVKRYNVSYNDGLSSKQVEERINDNLVNYDSTVKTKSIGSIIATNIFTLFNLLNLFLALAIIFVKSYKNLTFMGVVFCNIIIGILHEIQAKRTIDKLSIISSVKEIVVRNRKKVNINLNEIVLDDILYFKMGSQIVCDSIIQNGECEVNESLITGESDSIYKKKGDMLLSGSFIASGSCYAKVENIGKNNYASKISNEAKYIRKVNSEIMSSFKKIIKYISFLIIPIGSLLFYKQLSVSSNLEDAIVSTVAALIGMIPEGLILLTSTVLSVSVIRLAKYDILVQELYCIESLARVDVLCLDKTGTITEGNMDVSDVIPLKNISYKNIDDILSSVSASIDDYNATIKAISNKFNNKTDWVADKIVPFSSLKKWSSVSFKNKGTYFLGAPEVLFKKIDREILKYSENSRVLALGFSKNEDLNNIEPLALILLQDRIRKNAKETLRYFEEQDVDVKIISGDNVLTISNIAKRVEMKNYKNYIDMSNVKDDEIFDISKKYSIFGRVSPEQKKQLIVALKKEHTVAMTGDGVNDVLALKEADCSIAIAGGTDAARNVSQLVLLNSNFDSLPKVVAEGRRTINNIERSSSLFLVKTIYTTLLSIIFIFVNMSYPFIPIQMTLTSIVTIGVPSFILALEPNKERIKGLFLINVVRRSLPTALAIVCNIMVIVILKFMFNLSEDQASSLCVIITGFTGLMLLYKISYPFNLVRAILFYTMCLIFVVGIVGLRNLFSLTISKHMIVLLPALALLSFTFFNIFTNLFDYLLEKHIKRKNQIVDSF